jgi:hypothetical protein
MDRVASLLEQYPGPASLAMSRGRAANLLITSIFILGSAAYYAIQPTGIAGWLAVAFSALCATGLGAAFVRGRSERMSELVLDTKGFSIGHGRERREFTWAEVDHFAVVPDTLMLFRKRVGFNRASTAIDETNGFPSRDFVLPESYGLGNDECVRLLSLWRERALRTHRRDHES